jgi:hypothetical protein
MQRPTDLLFGWDVKIRDGGAAVEDGVGAQRLHGLCMGTEHMDSSEAGQNPSLGCKPAASVRSRNNVSTTGTQSDSMSRCAQAR